MSWTYACLLYWLLVQPIHNLRIRAKWAIYFCHPQRSALLPTTYIIFHLGDMYDETLLKDYLCHTSKDGFDAYNVIYSVCLHHCISLVITSYTNKIALYRNMQIHFVNTRMISSLAYMILRIRIMIEYNTLNLSYWTSEKERLHVMKINNLAKKAHFRTQFSPLWTKQIRCNSAYLSFDFNHKLIVLWFESLSAQYVTHLFYADVFFPRHLYPMAMREVQFGIGIHLFQRIPSQICQTVTICAINLQWQMFRCGRPYIQTRTSNAFGRLYKNNTHQGPHQSKRL